MQRCSLSIYTMDVVEPHVADVLYRLTERYTCRKIWKMAGSEEIEARPLPQIRHYQNVIWPSAKLYVALAEYTCKIYSGNRERFAVYPGHKQGEVQLTAGLGAEFKVYEGRSDYVELSNGNIVSGIVCPAKVHELWDKSTCVELDTRAGRIWLRTKSKKWGGFERGVQELATGRGSETVVELAEWEYSRAIKGPHNITHDPWEGLQTRDTSGRPWVITKSQVSFSAGMARLSLDDIDVTNFKGRPRLKLEPPYEVVWQPNAGNRAIYVPLAEY